MGGYNHWTGLEGSRCCLIPVLSGLQECNYVRLQYKQVVTLLRNLLWLYIVALLVNSSWVYVCLHPGWRGQSASLYIYIYTSIYTHGYCMNIMYCTLYSLSPLTSACVYFWLLCTTNTLSIRPMEHWMWIWCTLLLLVHGKGHAMI